MTPPMMAPMATTPTTTPAAIPALLGPGDGGSTVGVMMMVCPPSVIVAWGGDDVFVASPSFALPSVAGSSTRPVR